MAGCETVNRPGEGDKDWSKGRGALWFALGTIPGGVWAIAEIAAAALGASWLSAATVLFAAVATGLVAMFVGYGVEWFSRLKHQSIRTITVVGWVLCAKRNLGNWGPPAFCDGDWTFNLAPSIPPLDTAKPVWAVTSPGGLTMDDVRTRVAPGAEYAGRVVDPDNGYVDVFHTEIGSSIGDAAAVGGMIGAPVGFAAGLAIGAVICAAAGILTFGLGLLACLFALALAAAIGAAAGGAAGQWIGGAVGGIADIVNDFDARGAAIHERCFVALTGDWVTDRSHQHNEIHDISSFQIIDCGIRVEQAPLHYAGAVGTGRHPTGPDP